MLCCANPCVASARTKCPSSELTALLYALPHCAAGRPQTRLPSPPQGTHTHSPAFQCMPSAKTRSPLHTKTIQLGITLG